MPSIFERIIARELPAEILYEDEQVITLRDIAPRAPVHLLVVPKTPEYIDVVGLAAGDPELLAHVIAIAKSLAEAHTGGEFRLVFNTGARAGQSVFHVHAHVLGTTDGSTLNEDTLGEF